MKASGKLTAGCAAAIGAMAITSAAFADNPIVQTLYTADPAPMVYGGRVYVYTGHDEDTLVNNFFTMNDWRVFSSADMVKWTDHGSPLSYRSFSWAKGDAWAGQCIERGGSFYYYVPVTQTNGAMAIGVAVSSSPTGPFTDPLGHPLVTTSGCIDPTVFIDDDGQAYLYWGNPDLWYVRLNQDMISTQGTPTKVPLTTASFGTRTNTDRTTSYEEGPWFYKRGGRYYLVFAAGPISEHIGYSTSPGPTGPWTYGGVVMPTEGSSFTNHPGVIDFSGNSYFFYHNGALPGGGGFHRSVAVEQFDYNADGSIPTLHMTTGGPPGVGHLNPYVQTEAETIAWESGIETETCSEGGMNVSYIENGDYIKIKGVDFGSGATSFEARVASATSGGDIELHLDSVSGTTVGTCRVSGTGGWQTWTTVSCSVSGANTIHDLYLRFSGGGGSLFNFNWWKFQPIATGTGGTGGTGGVATGGVATGGVAMGGSGSGGAPSGGVAGRGGPGTGGIPQGAGGTTSGGASAGGDTSYGGVPAVGGMSGGTTSPNSSAGPSGEGSGCGCRFNHDSPPSSAWLLLAALGLAHTRRRRQVGGSDQKPSAPTS